jgi:hypothetical protein
LQPVSYETLCVAQFGDKNVVVNLLARRADPNIANRDGFTAWDCVAACK